MSTLFETISAAVSASIEESIKQVINAHVLEFAEVLSETSSDEFTVEKIIEIWNSIAVQFQTNSKTSKKPKASIISENEEKSKCVHIFKKGKQKDRECGAKISVNSTTKNFCNKHYKENEQSSKQEKDDNTVDSDDTVLPEASVSSDEASVVNTCSYITKKGKQKGTVCNKKISDKSTTGSFCVKHLSEEQEKKTKTTKTVNRNSSDDENDEEKEQEQQEEKEDEEQQEEKQEKKTVKTRKPKKVNKSSDDEQEEKEDEEKQEKKTVKKTRKQKTETKSVEKPVIEAKLFKTGAFKNNWYFLHEKDSEEVMYVINREKKIIGKLIDDNDELIDLDDEEKQELITLYGSGLNF